MKFQLVLGFLQDYVYSNEGEHRVLLEVTEGERYSRLPGQASKVVSRDCSLVDSEMISNEDSCFCKRL